MTVMILHGSATQRAVNKKVSNAKC